MSSAFARLVRSSSSTRARTFSRASTYRSTPTPPRRTFWSSSSSAAGPLELASNSLPHIDLTLFPIILAAILSQTDDSESNSTSPPWRVSSTTKGLGAFASQPLTTGQLLISERPLCIWPQGLSASQAKDLFEAMSENQRRVFLELARTEGEGEVKELDEIRAIRATNGFAVELPGGGKTASMVFPKIARINHSCLPVASQVMNFSSLRMEVYSITSVSPGTEVTIEYLPLVTQTRSERQQSLKNSFGFDSCLCSLCTGSVEEVQASDARRSEVRTIADSLRGGRKDRKATMEKLERIRVLLKEEGYNGLPEFEDTSISNAYAVFASMHQRAQGTVDDDA